MLHHTTQYILALVKAMSPLQFLYWVSYKGVTIVNVCYDKVEEFINSVRVVSETRPRHDR